MSTVSILSGKGGCGKTQTAQNLIAMHSLYDGKVGVIDADPTRQLTDWMLDTFPGMEVIEHDENKRPVHCKGDGVELRTTPEVKTIRKIITQMENDYGFVVVDTPGFSADIQQIVASVSDLVIYPANSTRNDYKFCLSAEDLIERVRGKVSHTILSCVYLNKINEQGNSVKIVRNWLEDEDIHVLKAQLPFYEAFKLCSFNGGIPTKDKPGEKIEELYREIWDLLGSIREEEVVNV